LIPFFEKQEACTVVMEACGAAHHWARMLTGLGHDVKLLAPEAVRPFVKKGKKNDAADAAAICAAASQPEMKFVSAKSLEQQATLALHSARPRATEPIQAPRCSAFPPPARNAAARRA
jgi:transposase